MTDEKLREAVIIAAGQKQSIRQLQQEVVQAKNERAAGEAVRTEGVHMLGEVAPFDGDPQQLRRDAARLLGIAIAPPTELASRIEFELSWAEIVSTNRHTLEEAGMNPDAVSLDSLIPPETLAIIDAEWQEFSVGLDAKLDEQAFQSLISSCRRAVLDAIIRPLGLGRLVERLDSTGGGVLTPFNAEAARAGDIDGRELANQGRLREFMERSSEPYDHKDYEANIQAMRAARFKDAAPLLNDYAPHRELPRDSRTHVDHVISAKQIHNDPDVNFFSSTEDKCKLAMDPQNLVFTGGALNRSKRDEKLSDWMDKESQPGKTNAERFGVDREAALRKEREAQAHIDANLTNPKLKYYLKETAMAGAADAAKVGLQQAIGAVLVELAIGLFDEISDLWRNGRPGVALLDDFITRAKRVGERVLASWRAVVEVFKQGSLAGFLSTIVTALINSVVTTGKRIIRVLREGILSLIRAVKLLAFPPPGMDRRQAGHEASKLIAAGLAVSVGIMIEEAVDKAISTALPALAPVASLLSTAVVGLGTGLCSVLLVALLDRIDFFGVVARERGERRLATMRERTDRLLDELLPAST